MMKKASPGKLCPGQKAAKFVVDVDSAEDPIRGVLRKIILCVTFHLVAWRFRLHLAISRLKSSGDDMLVRQPVVSGRFYPGDRTRLHNEVCASLSQAAMRLGEMRPKGRVWGVMLPHAGYVYCGNVIADTLVGADLPRRLIILCPNHTGHGRPIGIWPSGAWLTPLGSVPVDEALATELAAGDGMEVDIASHMEEHSIEVVLPYLQEAVGDISIVPVTVGTRDAATLRQAGHTLAETLRRHPDVGLVISSDMNHYEDHETTLTKDELALAKACIGDAEGLLDVVERENISMCGAPALAMSLFAARELGREGVAITSHATSGAVSGDYDRTVGYAGLRLHEGGDA